jgi:hypothetical protein
VIFQSTPGRACMWVFCVHKGLGHDLHLDMTAQTTLVVVGAVLRHTQLGLSDSACVAAE